MATLSSWGHNELIAIEMLVVGQVWYGRITFLGPVDLIGPGSVKHLSRGSRTRSTPIWIP
jgi:hypothetical protein